MRQVLCCLPPVHPAVGQRVRGAAVAVVERGERLRVAVADERDQIFVGEERVVSSVASHTVRLEGLYGVSRLLAPITDSTKSFRSIPKRLFCMRAPISGNGSSMTLPTSAQGP